MTHLLLIEQNNFTYTVANMEGDPDYNYLEVWGYDNQYDQNIYAPVGTPRIEDRFDVNGNHLEKVIFETKLAAALLRSYSQFNPMLHAIGNKMSGVLMNEYNYYKSKNLEDKFDEKISSIFKKYFYTDKAFFGKLGNVHDDDGKDYFDIAKKMLTKGKAIDQILFVHMAIGAILRESGFMAPENRKYNEIVKTNTALLRPAPLFKNRGRALQVDGSSKREITSTVGYVKSKQYSLNFLRLSPHSRAVDLYERDMDNVSDFCWNSWKKEIPFVAGPSGSAAECFAIFLTFYPSSMTNQLAENLQEYSACCVAYLVGSGAHSFHEVMSVAKLAGAVYKEGRYSEALPTSFIKTPLYDHLEKEFPNLLDRTIPALSGGDIKQFSVFRLINQNGRVRAKNHAASATVPPTNPVLKIGTNPSKILERKTMEIGQVDVGNDHKPMDSTFPFPSMAPSRVANSFSIFGQRTMKIEEVDVGNDDKPMDITFPHPPRAPSIRVDNSFNIFERNKKMQSQAIDQNDAKRPAKKQKNDISTI